MMILQVGRIKGQDENLQFTQGRMTRQKAMPLRPLRDYVLDIKQMLLILTLKI